MSIKYKITLLFILSVLFPFVAVGTLIYLDFNQTLEKTAVDKLVAVSTIQKNRVLDYIQGNYERLDSFSSQYQMRVEINSYNTSKSAISQKKITTILTEAKHSVPEYKDIHILNLQGTVIASTDPSQVGRTHRTDAFFRKGVMKQDISVLYKDAQKHVRQYLATPLFLDGNKIGVLAIEYDTKPLFDLFNDYTGLGKTGDWGMATRNKDGDGLIIVPRRVDKSPDSSLHSTISRKNVKNPAMATLLARHGQIFTDRVDYRGIPVIVVTQYIPEFDWELGVIIEKFDAYAASRALGNQLVFFGALIVLFVAFIGNFLTQIIIYPVLALRDAANKISAGDFSSVAPVTSHDEIGDLAVVFNQMAAAIRKHEDEHKALEIAKDEFVSIAAHQLRTPLGTMRWNLERILSGRAGPLTASFKKTSEDMSESNLRLITLVNSLLDVSRINQDKIIDHPQKTDITKVVTDTIHQLAPVAERKGVSVEFAPQKTPVQSLHLDPNLLAQVVDNLISNAIKYNKTNGKVKVMLQNRGSSVEMAVHDTGLGIPEAEQDKIFNKFFRASNAVLSEAEGTGLGLFIVKSYLDRWHGAIAFSSEVDKGSTFTISIPADQPHI